MEECSPEVCVELSRLNHPDTGSGGNRSLALGLMQGTEGSQRLGGLWKVVHGPLQGACG